MKNKFALLSLITSVVWIILILISMSNHNQDLLIAGIIFILLILTIIFGIDGLIDYKKNKKIGGQAISIIVLILASLPILYFLWLLLILGFFKIFNVSFL